MLCGEKEDIFWITSWIIKNVSGLCLSLIRETFFERTNKLAAKLDCKTGLIFAYSSTREQSNKRSGTRLKTESETEERR